MSKALTNPYLYIIGIPAVSFTILAYAQISPDPISLVVRIVLFGLYGYIGARYLSRAPSLIFARDTSPEAFNIVGWSLGIVGLMLSTGYGWLFIVYERPDWLASMYWNPAFTTLTTVGMAMVAWSIPRVGMFPSGNRGLSTLGAFLIGFLSAGSMFLIGHIPQIVAMVKGFIASAVRAV